MQLSHNVKGRRSLQRGFTLIELLTVIAIISLLIAIVVPGLSRARDQAKNTKTRSIMKAMGDGLELFRNENPDEVRGESYPSSAAADDPTEQGHQTIFGAQWAARYLLGKDMRGYVPKRVGKVFEPNAPQYWEQRDWYSDNATPNHPLDRVGPYLDVGQVTVRDPNSLPGSDTAGGAAVPAGRQDAGADRHSGHVRVSDPVLRGERGAGAAADGAGGGFRAELAEGHLHVQRQRAVHRALQGRHV